MQLLSLEEYTALADKFINYYYKTKGKMPKGFDYDSVRTDLVTALALSDKDFRTDHPSGISLRTFRSIYCLRVLYNYSRQAGNEIRKKAAYRNAQSVKDLSYTENPINEDLDEIQVLMNKSRLTPTQKQNFELYIEGWNSTEIGELTGKSSVNPRNILHRTLKKIRKANKLAE